MDHATIRANGAAFHVVRTGRGKPLLLLHGWPEFWLTWKPVMARLADRYTLIAPDLRGFGDSDKPTGPYGPAIVTADELPSGGAGLWIRSRLNGAIMQDGNTDDMIFSVARIIAYASQAMTLEPGDLIATGTPSGVGQARTPPVFMKPGDVVEIEIEGIPALRNPVVAAA